MSINRIDSPGRAAGLHAHGLQLNQRAVGQVVAVREGGLVDVTIAGRSYQAWSNVPVNKGDTLALRLVSLNPQPMYQVLDAREQADPEGGITLHLSGMGSGGRLWQSGPTLASLYQLLAQIDMQPGSKATGDLRHLLQVLERYVIDARDVGRNGRLKQQALGSGMFLEAMIAAGYPAEQLAADIKAQLFRALRRLQPGRVLVMREGHPQFEPQVRPDEEQPLPARPLPWPGQSPLVYGERALSRSPTGTLLQAYLDQQEPDEGAQRAVRLVGHNLEQTLVRLVSRQQEVLEQQEMHRQLWQIDLCVRRGEDTLTIPVTIGRHALADDHVWAISFRLDLPAAGRRQVEMQLSQNELDLHVIHERPAAQSALLKARGTLAQRLRAAGLTLESLSTALEDTP